MAQLSDDCFAFGDALLPLEEARRIIRDRISAVTETHRVPLGEADNRILAEDVAAPIDLPPFPNSAVDGYAVRFADLSPGAETILPVLGRAAAGDPVLQAAPGAAARVFTGAPMPAGADTIFMQEDVRLDEAGRAVLPAGLKPGANSRRAGEDLPAGTRALSAGRRLGPADLALLGALGFEQVPVRRALRVALASTGNEVARPGAPLPSGRLYDANRPMLAALLRRLGCTVTDLGILPDRREPVRTALAEAAASHHLVLTSGGVSTGEEDHVRAALAEIGALTFWRLAIKPGRPVAMGLAAGTPLVGLPGNPVAAFVTFALVARPLIERLAGEVTDPARSHSVAAGFAYRKKAGRREYVRVRLETSAEGGLVARKHPRDGAGVITSLTETDGLVELPEEIRTVEPGQRLAFLPYASLV